MFDAPELRKFARRLREGLRLVSELPSEIASLARLADDLVRLLHHHGRLDDEFFAALIRERPERADEIIVARNKNLAARREAVERDDQGLHGLSPPELATSRAGGPQLHEIARLPRLMTPHFRGREAELAGLDQAWDDPRTHVVSIVAEGGAGKSAVVRRWLTGMARRGWRGAKAVVGWSFASQGSRNAVESADTFFAWALELFGALGPDCQLPCTAEERARRLAGCLAQQRTLLVLDGVEPLQYGPGMPGGFSGRFHDPALRALLDRLCAGMDGLCVLSSRVVPVDLNDWAGSSALVVRLDRLSPEDGAALLADLGVHGMASERRAAADEVKGHALTLSLLGTYLTRVKHGDVRRRREVDFLVADERLAGGRARRMLEAYDAWFDETRRPVERALLRLMGLFENRADGSAVRAVRAKPGIPGLTTAPRNRLGWLTRLRRSPGSLTDITQIDDGDWQQALSNLREAGLLDPALEGDRDGLDAHPLVRAGFSEMLRRENLEGWRAGHLRLYEHYCRVAPPYPKTLEEMRPLLAAVAHGCCAGREQEVCATVYQHIIMRGEEFYLVNKLGAFGVHLSVLASFFERLWDLPAAGLSPGRQAWVLNASGSTLRALGRLEQALEPMQAGLERARMAEQWTNAAIAASNLSGLALTLGRIDRAITLGHQAVDLADRSRDATRSMINRTTLAEALHQSGAVEESGRYFFEAEDIQTRRHPHLPHLSSVQGYRYCDWLLSQSAWLGAGMDVAREVRERPEERAQARRMCYEVIERASSALEIGEHHQDLLSIALSCLAMGRAYLGVWLVALVESNSEPTTASDPITCHLVRARDHLDRAVTGLRQAGQNDYLPRGLLARVALYRLVGERDAARCDLVEASSLAERGPMPLFACDAHLEYARLHLATAGWDQAREHLDRVAAIIDTTGYHRRDRALVALRARIDAG